MIVVGSMSAFGAVYPFQWAFWYLDTHRSPEMLYKHRIQKTNQIDEAGYEKAWEHMPEMVLCTIPSVCLLGYSMSQGSTDTSNLPSLWPIFCEIALLSVANELGFYWSHRLLHVPYFYKRLHKIHHEFKAPAAMCGTYSHWIEHQILIAPLFIPVVLLETHLYTAVVWFFVALTGISLHHSGYEFPWTFGDMATQHDLHHEKFNGNYGVFGFFDVLCGTNIDKVTKKMVKDMKKV